MRAAEKMLLKISPAIPVKTIVSANDIKDIEVYYYDLVTGAHVGPGTIAVFYEGTTREFKKTGVIAKAKEKLGLGK